MSAFNKFWKSDALMFSEINIEGMMNYLYGGGFAALQWAIAVLLA